MLIRRVLVFFLMFSSLSFSSTGHAVYTSVQGRAGDVGLGLLIGVPAAISGKYWLQSDRFIDGALSWNSLDSGWFYVHSTYLWNRRDVLLIDDVKLDIYYGVGGAFYQNFDGDTHLGVRTPVGASYRWKNPSIEAFAELDLTVHLTPGLGIAPGLGVGARYFF
ncbi:MAG: hypothetical protein H6626_02100 [Pseudobdellovibrionaceae bacterium]|nr:hypothetical protein [Bdellovibrionales bacterium]USN47905.1 MAG: hypothetical protein H6626_02100 [Pseudobdellovibrionaceae bacterium]